MIRDMTTNTFRKITPDVNDVNQAFAGKVELRQVVVSTTSTSHLLLLGFWREKWFVKFT